MFSGGKDSTAMVFKMLELGYPLDYILFTDTGKEFPAMYRHIETVQNRLKAYSKTVTILRAQQSFDYFMFDHVKTKGKNQGKCGYGWATMLARWCTAALKQAPANRFIKALNDDVAEYIGIAADEPKRIRDKTYPLVTLGMTEKACLQYCYDLGFTWDGLYKDFRRVSCWCCPLKSIEELRILYNKYPELWAKLADMDRRAYNRYKADYSVDELAAKFEREKLQQSLF